MHLFVGDHQEVGVSLVPQRLGPGQPIGRVAGEHDNRIRGLGRLAIDQRHARERRKDGDAHNEHQDENDGNSAQGSGRELAFERGTKPRRHTHRTQPRLQCVGSRLDARLCLATNVFEQFEGERAVLALAPAADDAPVTPHRRPDVAGTVEQRGCM